MLLQIMKIFIYYIFAESKKVGLKSLSCILLSEGLRSWKENLAKGFSKLREWGVLMPFKKINVNDEIEKRLDDDPDLKNAYDQSELEYEVIKLLVRERNEMGYSQKDIAKQSGLTQQMVSRIETADNSPTLRNFLKYVNSLGLELKLEKKRK